MFLSNGITEIHDGDFVTAAQGGAGLRFTPAIGFVGAAGFAVQGATDALGHGLGDAAFSVRAMRIAPGRVSVPLGAVVRWRFGDPFQHDVTVADGPAGFSSPYATRGARFATRLTVPGEYRIYCSLHPVQMSQVVRVRAPGE